MNVPDVARVSGLDHAGVMRAALSLRTMGLAKVIENKRTKIFLSSEGKTNAEKGFPEKRLLDALTKMGGEATTEDLLKSIHFRKGLSTIALGWIIRKGWAKIDKKDQRLKLIREPAAESDEKLLSFLKKNKNVVAEDLDQDLRDAVSTLKERRLIKIHMETCRELELTENGWKTVKNGLRNDKEINQLTPQLIATGKWHDIKLSKYNIKAPTTRIWPGKKHPYLRFLDELKDKLVAFGFKEMSGPIVELSFFNCDGLYMPQDHPAREVHDMYLMKDIEYGNLDSYKQFVENVKETHENGWKTGSSGWGYSFSTREAARLMLRSQTTSVSARTLINDNLEIPGKYFAIARCYRPDVIDSLHLTEFNQVEGIVLGDSLTLLDLLGILKRFALDIAGADNVKFKPGYFPFTEPSVELQAYKKGYGWIEFGGSGIFRPEVTFPLGIKVPVLAWGLGVDRLFMMSRDIDDIRYLFTQDLNWLRHKELT